MLAYRQPGEVLSATILTWPGPHDTQTGDYIIAAVTCNRSNIFKVANSQRAMFFRAPDIAGRDDWINRFSLGQLKHRIMSHTGINTRNPKPETQKTHRICLHCRPKA